MSDTSKSRPNASAKRGSSATGSSVDIRTLLSRNEINTRLTAEPNPVSNVSEARSWLETKGWVLAGENYTKPKLADILFTVALSTKLTTEAGSAIKAVALLIEDLAEEDFSTMLSDKISLKIGTAIDDLRSEINNAKEFLSATSQKQASITLETQQAADKSLELSNKLAETSDKLSSLEKNPRQLATSAWPSLSRNAPVKNTYDPSVPPSHTKIQQRVLLEAQQVMIEYDSPHDVDGTPLPKDRSVEAQRALKDSFNGWFAGNGVNDWSSQSAGPSSSRCHTSKWFRGSAWIFSSK